jgi:hypothetical protein
MNCFCDESFGFQFVVILLAFIVLSCFQPVGFEAIPSGYI